jgi:hypothetical protein
MQSIALLLQGGGALGAYELHETGQRIHEAFGLVQRQVEYLAIKLAVSMA